MKRTTHYLLIVAVALAGWIMQPAAASAERVKTTRTTRVYARPGESARVIKRLPSGRSVTVLARKGRWIKVRVGSETGYLTRTSVISSQTPRAARTSSKTRSRRPSFVEGRSRRSDRGPEDRRGGSAVEDDFEEFEDEEEFDEAPAVEEFGAVEDEERFEEEEDFGDEEGEDSDDEDGEDDQPRVVAMANSDAYRKPNSRSGSVFEVDEGDSFTLVKSSPSGKWMLVEDGRGDRGWVRADKVEASSEGAYQYEKMAYNAGVGLAYTSWSQQFRSADGVGQLANYDINSAAVTVGLQGEFIYKYSEKYLLGADVGGGYSRSSPGIRFVDGAGNAADIPFTVIELHPTVRAGYNFQHEMGLAAYARVGYLYNKLDITNGTDPAQNPALLPSEILSGFTVGAMIDAPRVTDKIKARLVLDMLASGAREQTVGLEDGAESSVGAFWANLQVEYAMEKFDLYGSARYLSSSTDFAGMAVDSQRGHNATTAERLDNILTIGIGVIKTF